jgi:hypothetical protein
LGELYREKGYGEARAHLLRSEELGEQAIYRLAPSPVRFPGVPATGDLAGVAPLDAQNATVAARPYLTCALGNEDVWGQGCLYEALRWCRTARS